MRFFIAGIMQGSHRDAILHEQDYRAQLASLLGRFFPDSDVYDPRGEHPESLGYDDQQGRDVFMAHNRMCREVDVVLAFLPEASMGTAIEMWEAYCHGRTVVVISPLKHNWVVRYCSHMVLANVEALERALEDGSFQQLLGGATG
jgi:hypothetical protein